MRRLIIACGVFALTLSASLVAHGGTADSRPFTPSEPALIEVGIKTELESTCSGFDITFPTISPRMRHRDFCADSNIYPSPGLPSSVIKAGVQNMHLMAAGCQSTKSPISISSTRAQEMGRLRFTEGGGTAAPFFFDFS